MTPKKPGKAVNGAGRSPTTLYTVQRAPRRSRRVPAEIQVLVVTDESVMVGTLTDLSRDGAFLEGASLRQGQQIQVAFTHLHSGPLTVGAQVVHRTQKGAGLRFLEAPSLPALRALLDWTA